MQVVAHAIADVLRAGETERLQSEAGRAPARRKRESAIRELRRTHTDKVDFAQHGAGRAPGFSAEPERPAASETVGARQRRNQERCATKPQARKRGGRAKAEAREAIAARDGKKSRASSDPNARARERPARGKRPLGVRSARSVSRERARMTTIVWFRQDLRLRGQPGARCAVKRGGAVVPVYIWSPEDEGDWPPGAASRWWLHQSLQALERSLRERGSRLVLAKGTRHRCSRNARRSERAPPRCTGIAATSPPRSQCSQRVEAELAARGIEVASFNSALLAEPHEVLNQSGKPYRVYTPYLSPHAARPEPPRPCARLEAGGAGELAREAHRSIRSA